jgi:hypothetical protein
MPHRVRRAAPLRAPPYAPRINNNKRHNNDGARSMAAQQHRTGSGMANGGNGAADKRRTRRHSRGCRGMKKKQATAPSWRAARGAQPIV